jgi:hypothetical protein
MRSALLGLAAAVLFLAGLWDLATPLLCWAASGLADDEEDGEED